LGGSDTVGVESLSVPTCVTYVFHTKSYLAAWFRLFVGDLSNDVSDDVLTNAFNKYTSFTKARVIRDRLSQKVSNILLSRYVACSLLFLGQIWFRGVL